MRSYCQAIESYYILRSPWNGTATNYTSNLLYTYNVTFEFAMSHDDSHEILRQVSASFLFKCKFIDWSIRGVGVSSYLLMD